MSTTCVLTRKDICSNQIELKMINEFSSFSQQVDNPICYFWSDAKVCEGDAYEMHSGNSLNGKTCCESGGFMENIPEGKNSGFCITIPSDDIERQLDFIVGAYEARSTLEIFLNGNDTPAFATEETVRGVPGGCSKQYTVYLKKGDSVEIYYKFKEKIRHNCTISLGAVTLGKANKEKTIRNRVYSLLQKVERLDVTSVTFFEAYRIEKMMEKAKKVEEIEYSLVPIKTLVSIQLESGLIVLDYIQSKVK